MTEPMHYYCPRHGVYGEGDVCWVGECRDVSVGKYAPSWPDSQRVRYESQG